MRVTRRGNIKKRNGIEQNMCDGQGSITGDEYNQNMLHACMNMMSIILYNCHTLIKTFIKQTQ